MTRCARKTYDSTQSIDLGPTPDSFDHRTDPDALLRTLHLYFKVAEQCAGGLVRIRWSSNRPRFVLVWPPVPMLCMGEPTFEHTSTRRAIRVAVQGGLLVSPTCRTSLSLAFTRNPESLSASVELRDYAPRAGHLSAVDWLYRHTQARVHEWVGLRYVRLLRRQWLGQPNHD